MTELKWDKLLNPKRFSNYLSEPKPEPEAKFDWLMSEKSRTEQERDYDRILFSTPVRRMASKTQVFPLDKNISIRTRLTHSHEVANLARSIGTFLTHGKFKGKFGEDAERNVPAVLGAVGLAHDLGNPPFGHSGEDAIRSWFRRKMADGIFNYDDGKNKGCLTAAQQNDFLEFEGNAQALRLLMRLQHVGQSHGLKLTFGTLASLMKYPESSETHAGRINKFKKFGYFQSEKDLVKTVFEQTGLDESIRHPLAFIMEACDDIAYLVIDAEDAVKKQIASFADLMAWLETRTKDDPPSQHVIGLAKKDYEEYSAGKFTPAELNDISMQKFRVYAIHMMVSAAVNSFEQNYDKIMSAQFTGSLLSNSHAKKFEDAIRKFDLEYAYKHKSVLALETQGYNAINGIMDMLWEGIISRKPYEEKASKRTTPFAKYAYSRISDNYRRVFEIRTGERANYPELPLRYYELQLLTDMVSGMADNYALDLYDDLNKHYVGASVVNRK